MNNTKAQQTREMTWEERVQWVMKNTDVEWENLFIAEEIAKPTTPTHITTIQVGEEIITKYEYQNESN
jgi:hypothetical protein